MAEVTLEKVRERLGRDLEKREEGMVKRWIHAPVTRFRPGMPGTSEEVYKILVDIEEE